MKRLLVFLAMLFVFAGYVGAEGYAVHKTWTTTVPFMGGDTANAVYVDTTYFAPMDRFRDYKFARFYYQANFNAQTIASCTSFVLLQTGMTDYWTTLKTDTIVSDSLFSTTGYDLLYTTVADSIHDLIRYMVIVQMDSTGSGPVTVFADSSCIITHNVDILAK